MKFFKGKHSPSPRKNPTGVYYTIEQEADQNAANLILQILPERKNLKFSWGYLPAEGVARKVFTDLEKNVTVFKTKREGRITSCIIVTKKLAIAFNVGADQIARNIREVDYTDLK